MDICRTFGLLAVLLLALPAGAQVKDTAPPFPVPLGELVRDSTRIVLMEVWAVDHREKMVAYRFVADLKGRSTEKKLQHSMASLWYGEAEDFYLWVRLERKVIVFFGAGPHTYICTGNFWYSLSESTSTDGRSLHADEAMPQFSRCYAGSVEGLRKAIEDLVAGRETVITAESDHGYDSLVTQPRLRDWVHGKKGRVWRIKARVSPNRKEELGGREPYRPAKIVGWGVGGAECVPGLRAKLTSANAIVRAEAAEDLGWLGEIARPALPDLRRALRDEDPYVRMNAAEALARLEPGGKPELRPMLDGLKLDFTRVRICAAMALADLGRRAQSAVPVLAELLRDEDGDVRAAAAFAIGRIGISPETPLGRRLALARQLGQQVKSTLYPPAAYWAGFALRQLGADAWPAVRALALAAREQGGAFAADALARLDPPAVSVLADVLADPVFRNHNHIPELLGEIGPRAWPALPALAALLPEDELPSARGDLEEALLRVDPAWSVDRLVPRISGLFENRDHRSWQAFDPMYLLAPHSEKAVELLTARSKVGDDHARAAAALTLGKLGRTRAALDTLIPMLKHERTRGTAASFIGGLGPDASEAAPALKEALRGLDERDPHTFRRAICAIEGGSRRRAALVYLADAQVKADRLGSHPRFHLGHGPGDEVFYECGRFIEAADDVVSRICAEPLPRPFLVDGVGSKSVYERHAAAIALCHFGEQARALPVLLQTIDERPSLLVAASGTLATLGPQARAAIPRLTRALHHENPIIHREAALALRSIDPRALSRAWGILHFEGSGTLALSGKQIEECWEKLASTDSAEAYEAGWKLALAGPGTITLLEQRLRSKPADRAFLDNLITDLDSKQYAVRHKAEELLRQHGWQAESALRQALGRKPTLEARKRIERLLEHLDPLQSPAMMRVARAVDVLEQIATPRPVALLTELAGGDPRSRLARHAKDALIRVEWRAAP